MAIKFALRGNSLNAYKHSGSGKVPIDYDINAGGPPAVVVDAAAIGGFAIDYSYGGAVKGHIFPAFDNSTKTGIISLLSRIAPTYTGAPGSNSNTLCVSGAQHTSANSNLLQLDHLTNGNLVLTLTSPTGSASQTFANQGAWSPVAGQYYDVVLTWNGTTAANGIKIYIDGVLFAQATASVTWAAGALHTIIGVGVGLVSQITALYKLNELVLWDSVIDPTSGGLNLNGSARASFVTVTGVLDPTNSTDPGIANVRSATGYIINGSSLTGTAAIPAAADVRTGTAVDATVGSLDVPAATDVRSGTAVDAGTGSAEIPVAADVRLGTATDATTGTLAVPAASDVRSGVAVDNTVGTLTVLINEVRQGVLTENGVAASENPLLTITRGDTAVLQFRAEDGDGNPVDLTGASFITYQTNPSRERISFANGKHTANADQVTHTGEFSISLTAADTRLIGEGALKEVLTLITQGGSDKHYRAMILRVLPPYPAS